MRKLSTQEFEIRKYVSLVHLLARAIQRGLRRDFGALSAPNIVSASERPPYLPTVLPTLGPTNCPLPGYHEISEQLL